MHEAVEEAFQFGQPEIFNTDQGVQFTSIKLTSILENHNTNISMDGVVVEPWSMSS
jgi:putative transposase